MPRDLTPDERTTLETLMDAAGVAPVLEALSEICSEKADHIRQTYQDNVTARIWDTACGWIGCAAADVSRTTSL